MAKPDNPARGQGPGTIAALEAIGTLPDNELDLGSAAIQLGRLATPDADWQAASAHLSTLARDAVALASELADGELSSRAGALAALLSGRHGYQGDLDTYDDLDNANLIRVIERRRGLPVSLGILWLHCAQAAGWLAHGIDFPGHFLVGMQSETRPGRGTGSQVVLDVFAGGMPMDAVSLRGLLKRVEGKGAELRPGLIRPMSQREVLLRLQRNVVSRHLDAGDRPAALAAIEAMLAIAPDEASIWREAALLNQRLDHVAAALRCLERFLALSPPAPAAARARAMMDELRARLN